MKRWTLPFAILMMLLTGLFVALYGSSESNRQKLEATAEGLRKAFDAERAQHKKDLHTQAKPPSVDQLPVNEAAQGESESKKIESTLLADIASQAQGMEKSLSSDPSDPFSLYRDDRGLVIKLAMQDFFEINSAEIAPDLEPLLLTIGRAVGKSKRMLRVEGHADLQESGGSRYASDWELSAARAASVVRLWTEKLHLTPSRLSLMGFGKNHPLKRTDESTLSQGLNRRIEIVILDTDYR